LVSALRDDYRRRHLHEVAPDGKDASVPEGEWVQLIGAAYDRRIYVFEIETIEEQDARLIDKLNSQSNISHFNLLFHNCADFSRSIINFYYPHAVRRSFVSDQGITTPKQVAKSLASYGRRHSDLQFSVFVIDQIPGTVTRSRPIRGVLESFVKSKKYALPVAVLHPLIVGSLTVAYLTTVCSDPHRHFARQLEHESEPAAIIADLRKNHSAYSNPVSAGMSR